MCLIYKEMEVQQSVVKTKQEGEILTLSNCAVSKMQNYRFRPNYLLVAG